MGWFTLHGQGSTKTGESTHKNKQAEVISDFCMFWHLKQEACQWLARDKDRGKANTIVWKKKTLANEKQYEHI